MATLDDKILDGPNVGYCSDSDEDTPAASSGGGGGAAGAPSPGRANTGPKGVLADYGDFVVTERHAQRQKEANVRLGRRGQSALWGALVGLTPA